MSTKIRLLTRGDDAGSAHSANRAIRECFEKGFLRNASILAVGPAVEEAAELLGNLPGLCLGLHVCLNCEWVYPKWGPLLTRTQVPSLVDDAGYLTCTPNDLAARQPSAEEMLREVKAQLARLRKLGLKLEYLDQHMGVGWVPGLNDALADLCRQEGLINADALFRLLPRLPLPPQPSLQNLQQRLEAAEPGTYIFFTHPCYDDVEMHAYHLPGQAPGVMAAERNGDRLLLLSNEIRTYAEKNGIEFVRFSDCR